MTSQAKRGVIDIEFADSAYTAYSAVHPRNQIGEGARFSKVRATQTPRCRFEGGPRDPSLMRVPLTVGPPSKTCFVDRGLKVLEITEVAELADSLVTVTADVVLHDRNK